MSFHQPIAGQNMPNMVPGNIPQQQQPYNTFPIQTLSHPIYSMATHPPQQDRKFPQQNRRKRRINPSKTINSPKNTRVQLLEDQVNAMIREKEEAKNAASQQAFAARVEALANEEKKVATEKQKLLEERNKFDQERVKFQDEIAKFEVERINFEQAKKAFEERNSEKRVPWYRRPIF